MNNITIRLKHMKLLVLKFFELLQWQFHMVQPIIIIWFKPEWLGFSVTCNQEVLINTVRSDGGLGFLSCRMKVTG